VLFNFLTTGINTYTKHRTVTDPELMVPKFIKEETTEKILDKDYSKLDIPLKRLVPVKMYGLDSDYYGGNVTHIGEIKDSPILLLIDNRQGMRLVDTAVKYEDLDKIDMSILKNVAKARKIEFNWKTITKDEIVKLLKKKK
jgi:hypothetical protein